MSELKDALRELGWRRAGRKADLAVRLTLALFLRPLSTAGRPGARCRCPGARWVYSSLQVPELKDALRELGLSRTGRKADLQLRLAVAVGVGVSVGVRSVSRICRCSCCCASTGARVYRYGGAGGCDAPD